MTHIEKMYNKLCENQMAHKDYIYNYAIPTSWNTYGYKGKKLLNKEILVDPFGFYAFTLKKIMDQGQVKEEQDWFKQSSIYTLMVKVATAWDHDRDDNLSIHDLYGFNDHGTFLKSIMLIPYWKRMGINTIILEQFFKLGESQTKHTYAKKECIFDFLEIDPTLHDPLLSDMPLNEQYLAFVEACHMHGIHVIGTICPAIFARENVYMEKHPEWFYWISKEDLKKYKAPECPTLPPNIIPNKIALKELYRSKNVLTHIQKFVDPKKSNLKDITIAPIFSDRINSEDATDFESTIPVFYLDHHQDVPKSYLAYPPYITQDIIRCDLHPGKVINATLWDFIIDTITTYIKDFIFDGLYIEKPYLLPEELLNKIVKTAKTIQPNIILIAQEGSMNHSLKWVEKGFDAISGIGGYEEHLVYERKFHDFAYQLKESDCPVFASCEFSDTKRIINDDHGETLVTMLSMMNLFIPNGIPMMMNGLECLDEQPLQLNENNYPQGISNVSRNNIRYGKQAYLDPYAFNYTLSQLHILPNILSKCHKIRKAYMNEIINNEKSMPVWFHPMRASGLGYSFMKEDRVLMVICNTNISQNEKLCIRLDNLAQDLSFDQFKITQIYSSTCEFKQLLQHDMYLNINLEFMPGEVKFIEITQATTK